MPRLAIPENEILEAALSGLRHTLAEVEGKIADLDLRLGGRGSRRAAAAPARKHTLSAAARKRIALAQKKRWAAFRKTQK